MLCSPHVDTERERSSYDTAPLTRFTYEGVLRGERAHKIRSESDSMRASSDSVASELDVGWSLSVLIADVFNISAATRRCFLRFAYGHDAFDTTTRSVVKEQAVFGEELIFSLALTATSSGQLTRPTQLHVTLFCDRVADAPEQQGAAVLDIGPVLNSGATLAGLYNLGRAKAHIKVAVVANGRRRAKSTFAELAGMDFSAPTTAAMPSSLVVASHSGKPAAIPASAGGRKITVGTQTTETRIASGRLMVSRDLQALRDTIVTTNFEVPAATTVAWGGLSSSASLRDANVSSELRDRRDDGTLPPTAATTIPVRTARLGVDVELLRKSLAAWPVDEIEGLLTYCQHLKDQKDATERALLARTVSSTKAMARRLQAGTDAGDFVSSPQSVQRQLSVAERRSHPPAASSSFTDGPDNNAGGDATTTLDRVARLALNRSLSPSEKRHLAQHYEQL